VISLKSCHEVVPGSWERSSTRVLHIKNSWSISVMLSKFQNFTVNFNNFLHPLCPLDLRLTVKHMPIKVTYLLSAYPYEYDGS
jgi:hypothetical protein